MKKLTYGQTVSSIDSKGRIVLDTEGLEKYTKLGNVILIKEYTTPNDLMLVDKSNGLITIKGGMLCHAAIVSRELGKSCIINCSDIKIDLKNKCINVGENKVNEGELIEMNSNTGEIFLI